MAEPHKSGPRDADAETLSRLWERVVPLFASLEGQLDTLLTRRHGIGLGPLMALGALAGERPGSVTVSGLARRLGVSVSAASRMLTHLERSGWTARTAWPCDRRTSHVTVTDAGLTLWTRASRTLEHELDAAFGALRFDERYAHVVARLCHTGDATPRD
ncbi:MarR family transcriptional regulator [Streptomyces longwoodensis]|uniref:MarR family winged helix-turn-helix transcriptional regulator n=1 Tax=Streptomyces longwoodensis TaxID=68231 RepID=UPI00339EDA4D